MKKITVTGLCLLALCLLSVLPAAMAETREGVITLEGMEETIQETLYESPQGFSFWYANEGMKAYEGVMDNIEGTVVAALYSDDYMILSMIGEEDAAEYAGVSNADIAKRSGSARVQMDIYNDLAYGRYCFLTLIAENGRYLCAVGEYSQEAAEGNAKYFQRVLDSVAFPSDYDADMIRQLPGQWTEAHEGAGTVLTLKENGEMTLYCYGVNGGAAYTCEGAWAYESVPDETGRMKLLFTSTDNPQRTGSGYSVECVYAAYTESWVENDTVFTYLILNPPISCSGVSPFEEVFGEDGAALHREQGPNMRVVKCKEFVSLREKRSKSSKRLAKVPLGALVLAFPEAGEENGFIFCSYHDEYGYILSEYLRPVE